MWIAKESPGDIAAAIEELDGPLKKKLKMRAPKGGMRHTPVLNVCESVFKLCDVGALPSHGCSATSITSPAQPLPQANYSTVMDRWRRWTVGNDSIRPGCSVDPDGTLTAAGVMDSPKWKNISAVRDCLQLNSNIVAKCEDAFRARRAELQDDDRADGVPTIFSLNCCGHMCVLGLKPILSFYPGLNAHVVRCGHVCQSSRPEV
eukprot:2063669-Pyramimonas_sp.AAC.1